MIFYFIFFCNLARNISTLQKWTFGRWNTGNKLFNTFFLFFLKILWGFFFLFCFLFFFPSFDFNTTLHRHTSRENKFKNVSLVQAHIKTLPLQFKWSYSCKRAQKKHTPCLQPIGVMGDWNQQQHAKNNFFLRCTKLIKDSPGEPSH